jgi:hypothetical protein
MIMIHSREVPNHRAPVIRSNDRVAAERAAIGFLCFIVLIALPPPGGFAAFAGRGETDGASDALRQSAPYRIGSTVVGSAGSPGSSASYASNGTLGQATPVGPGSAGGKALNAGFWGILHIVTATEEIPLTFRLQQNYPNPFNPSTKITFSIAAPCAVDLAIYDVGGRRIKRLVHETRAPGRYAETWDGTNDWGGRVATGLYFYRLKAGSFVSSKKMVLIK